MLTCNSEIVNTLNLNFYRDDFPKVFFKRTYYLHITVLFYINTEITEC